MGASLVLHFLWTLDLFYLAVEAGCLTEERTRCIWESLVKDAGHTAWNIPVCSYCHNAVMRSHDPSMSSHDPTMISCDPTQQSHDPTMSPHDPTMSSHDPTMSPHDPTMISCDPTRQSHDPTMSPHDPTMSPHDLTMSSHDPTMSSHAVTLNCIMQGAPEMSSHSTTPWDLLLWQCLIPQKGKHNELGGNKSIFIYPFVSSITSILLQHPEQPFRWHSNALNTTFL